MKIVIVGLGAAGFAALLAARKQDRSADITVIDEKGYLLHNCGLTYAIEGYMPLKDLKHDVHMKYELVKGKADSVDYKAKKVMVDGKSVSYDKLILCPGAKTFIPEIKGNEKAYYVHDIESSQKVLSKAKCSKKAVVVGAGAIGLETAAALCKLGLDVTVVEMKDRLMPYALDKDMSEVLLDRLKCIKFVLNGKVDSVDPLVVDGKSVKADMVVMATGVKGDVSLASDLKVDKLLKVNDKMQTSDKDVYAAGDCVVTKNIIDGKEMVVQLATNAYLQGLVAGRNAAGGSAKYNGTALTYVSVVDGVEVASTGFNSDLASSKGISVVSAKVVGKDKAAWFPGAADLIVKLLADKKGKIVGCQAIGNGAASRINVVSVAIKAGFKVEDLLSVELAYCPPVSDVYDALLSCAELVLRKLA